MDHRDDLIKYQVAKQGNCGERARKKDKVEGKIDRYREKIPEGKRCAKENGLVEDITDV